jgi:non-canonical (house-cleaning) NTP pyrophosphatase
VAVAVAVVNALKMQPTNRPLQSAKNRAMRAAKKAVQKDAMVALSALVALMKTATTCPWSKTAKPLSV